MLPVLMTGSWLAVHAQDLGRTEGVPPVQFNAGIQLQAGFYHVRGIDPRHTPFTWSISGTPTATIKGVELPFTVIISDQHRSFQQPFNQFGISPKYKWVKVHLGYRDVAFSRFTLAGFRTLMAGVELNPKKFRFGFIYGRFQKAVEEDTAAVYDPSRYISDVPVPAYHRSGFAVKVGVGTEDQYVDLVLLRARDDASSIRTPVLSRLEPAENLAIGLVGKVKLTEKLGWEFDVAGSAYTRDVRAERREHDLSFMDRVTDGLIKTRISTQNLMALETGLSLKRKRARYKLTYRRVDPDYKSMGAYYFQTDVEQVTGTVAGTMAKGRLSSHLTLGWQHNNLKKIRSATARRIIGNLGLNYTSKKVFGLMVNYTNYGVTQTLERVTLNDTALVKQVSQNLLLQPRVRFAVANGSHTASLSTNYFALSNRVENAFSQAQLTGMHNDLAYTRGWKQRQGQAGGGFIYRLTDTQLGKTTSTGAHLEGGRSWLEKDRLGTRLRTSYLSNRFSDGGRGSTVQLDLQASYQASQRVTFTLTVTHQDNRSNSPVAPDFTEDLGLIGANIRF